MNASAERRNSLIYIVERAQQASARFSWWLSVRARAVMEELNPPVDGMVYHETLKDEDMQVIRGVMGNQRSEGWPHWSND